MTATAAAPVDLLTTVQDLSDAMAAYGIPGRNWAPTTKLQWTRESRPRGRRVWQVSSVTNHWSSTTRSRFPSISIPCFRPIAGEVFVMWLLAFLFCRYSSREWLLRLSMLKLAGGIWVFFVGFVVFWKFWAYLIIINNCIQFCKI